MAVESPTIPNEFLKYPKNMPKTNSIGVYGTRYLLFIYLKMAPLRMPKMRKNMTNGPL